LPEKKLCVYRHLIAFSIPNKLCTYWLNLGVLKKSGMTQQEIAGALTEATIKLLKPYKGALHTITADNVKEFAYHERLTNELGAAVYFARPYHSWERGLNENTNGLLRQYWPKSMDLKKVTNKEIVAVVTQLNQRPRKTLGFKTPEVLMHNHMAAEAA
jgi:IS30 family transposase